MADNTVNSNKGAVTQAPAAGAAKPANEPTRSSSYKVEKGDTLSTIAHRWAQLNPDLVGKDKPFKSWRDVQKELYKLNELEDKKGKRCDGEKITDARILAGQELKLPEGIAINGVQKTEELCKVPDKKLAPAPLPEKKPEPLPEKKPEAQKPAEIKPVPVPQENPKQEKPKAHPEKPVAKPLHVSKPPADENVCRIPLTEGEKDKLSGIGRLHALTEKQIEKGARAAQVDGEYIYQDNRYTNYLTVRKTGTTETNTIWNSNPDFDRYSKLLKTQGHDVAPLSKPGIGSITVRTPNEELNAFDRMSKAIGKARATCVQIFSDGGNNDGKGNDNGGKGGDPGGKGDGCGGCGGSPGGPGGQDSGGGKGGAGPGGGPGGGQQSSYPDLLKQLNKNQSLPVTAVASAPAPVVQDAREKGSKAIV